jgi:hypothetical protein
MLPLFLQFRFTDSSWRGTIPIVAAAALPLGRAGLTGCVEPVPYWRAYGR